ncbi:hypothetical protein BN1708_019597, partial [Verticillium longisporum]
PRQGRHAPRPQRPAGLPRLEHAPARARRAQGPRRPDCPRPHHHRDHLPVHRRAAARRCPGDPAGPAEHG